MIRDVKEEFGYVVEKEEKIEVKFSVKGRPRLFDVTEQLKEACEMIIPDLTDAIYELIGSFDPEFQASLRNNVIVCGGGSRLYGLRPLIENALE